ncbi:uncharacterized protein cp110 [Osmerus mordax]|uniref:uncharacterized protein cp110 n=1 Tax=Osmerus mordax TaxID=8014 RepID=UPI003510B39D
MEDYEDFARRRLLELRLKGSNVRQPSNQQGPGCHDDHSVIRFRGLPILPPLLSAEQRGEMQRYREEACSALDKRNTLLETRMSRIQNILHSVQLRRAPTLEEFIHGDPGLAAYKAPFHASSTSRTPPSLSDDASVSQSDDALESVKDCLSCSPQSGLMHDGKPFVSDRQLTSTAYSAFSTNRLTHPLRSNQMPSPMTSTEPRTQSGDREMRSQDVTSEPLADVSHQTQSSGYDTYDNAERSGFVSTRAEEREGVAGLEQDTISQGGFFLHDTTSMMPDVIGLPPLGGRGPEEKCDEEPDTRDGCLHGDSVEEARSDLSRLDDVTGSRASGGPAMPSPSCVDQEVSPPMGNLGESHPGSICEFLEISTQSKQGQNMDARAQGQGTPTSPEGHAACKGTSVHPQRPNPDPAEPLNRPKGQDEEPGRGQEEENTELEPQGGPYRLSLQTLLKKSQEHRRRQRQLRNQAKAMRTRDGGEEQGRRRGEEERGGEEQGFSDKENDEFPKTGRTLEGRRTRERRREPAMGTFRKEAWGPGEEAKEKSRYLGREESAGRDSGKKRWDGERDREGGSQTEALTSEDVHLDLSPEVMPQSRLTDLLPLAQYATSTALEAPVQTRGPGTASGPDRPPSLRIGKFHIVPTPQFCMSPVRCKSKGNEMPGRDCRGVTSMGNLQVNAPLDVEDLQDPAGPSVSPTAPPVTGGGIAGVPVSTSSEQGEQIALLELNLSSLKALISDLENTLTEPPENHTHTGDGHTHTAEHHTHTAARDLQAVGRLARPGPADDGELDVDHKRSHGDRSLDAVVEGTDLAHHVHVDVSRLFLQDEEGWTGDLRETGGGREGGGEREGGGGGALTLSSAGGLPCRVQWSDLVAKAEEVSIVSYRKQEVSQTQKPVTRCVTSLAQKMRVLDVFRKVPPETNVPYKTSILADTSNHRPDRHDHDSSHFLSLNRSYDVDMPSGLWDHEASGSELKGHNLQVKQLTPENWEGGGQGGASRAKRRLLMQATEENEGGRGGGRGAGGGMDRPLSSTPKGSMWRSGGVCVELAQQKLKHTHAAQVRVLQEEQKQQQLELLQTLAVRYRLLQSVSFPCPAPSSRLLDVPTALLPPSPPSSPLPDSPPASPSQSPSALPVCLRPLLAALVKGYLTRRLLKTERVGQLLRTIKDTQRFLQAFRPPHTPQTPGRGEFSSRQDLLLQERVSLQLRSALYEVHDVFFRLRPQDRMQIISWDRQLDNHRKQRQQAGYTGQSRRSSSLSAATQKALERKRGVMIQKKTAERQKGVKVQPGVKVTSGVVESLRPARGQFKPNHRRVPKTTPSRRPR